MPNSSIDRKSTMDPQHSRQTNLGGGMNLVCPWDRWLRFRCPQTEHGFMISMEESVANLDRNFFTFGIIYCMARMISCEASGWNYLGHQAGHLFIILVTAFMYWCTMNRRGLYAPGNFQGRIRIMGSLRVVASCIDVVVMTIGDDPAKIFVTNFTFLRIITHTGIAPVLMEGFAMQFPFKQHLMIQGVDSALAMTWIFRFQSECAVNEQLADNVNQIGYIIEEVLVRMSVMGFPLNRPLPASGDYPCWLVGGFWHVVVAFLLPMLVIYCVESRSRIRYLKDRRMPRNVDANGLNMFFWIGLVEKILICMIGLQVSWFTLKALADGELHCQKGNQLL
ncbi:hypothetical protein BSKO_06721 [Bryopsis sp. KO-2023]|nr:hypothetical protein BSKO_06721 [Bryopsis sp. KO-2023]